MENEKINLVCNRRLGKYLVITEKALLLAEKNIDKSREKEANEILTMVKAYVSDAKHFQKQGHLVNSFAAVNYAHGWLDSGARLGIFKVKDNKLFTIE